MLWYYSTMHSTLFAKVILLPKNKDLCGTRVKYGTDGFYPEFAAEGHQPKP